MRSIEASPVGVVGNNVTMSCVATYFNMLSAYPIVTWHRTDDPDTAITETTSITKVSEMIISCPPLSGFYYVTNSLVSTSQSVIIYLRNRWLVNNSFLGTRLKVLRINYSLALVLIPPLSEHDCFILTLSPLRVRQTTPRAT